jgi:aryl-alcohol dehydrogenase-like predicted oxidoreductase
MRRRRFGSTDLVVSEVTFGALRFVDGAQARNDERLGKRALLEALASGVDTIHSSHEYDTRWALGDVLASHPKRHDLHHVIKVLTPDYADPGFDEATFRRLIEDALRELHAERIAVVQHLQRGVPKEVIYDERGDPPRIRAMTAVNEDLRAAFDKLRDAGKVGHLATFPHTPGFAAAAIRSGAFDGMVAFLNLLETEMWPYFEEMRERGMGLLSMRPFLQGIITDKRARRADLAADDPKRAPAWDATYARFERLQAVIGREVRSWTDLAIGLALADPLVASVIVGMNSPEQVRLVLAAADGAHPDRAFVERVHRIHHES